MSSPTPKQTRAIWGFCVRYGSTGHDHDKWVRMGRAGTLTKLSAMSLIGKFKAFEQAPSKEGKLEVERAFRVFEPQFKVTKDPFPGGPKPLPVATETPEGEGGGDGPAAVPAGVPVEPEDGEKDRVKELLSELQEELEKKIKPKRPAGVPAEFEVSPDYIPPKEFPEIVALVQAGVNVLLVGPAGSGKSRLAREVAVALKQTAHEPVNFGGSMRYPQIFGSTKLVVNEAGVQVTKFEPAMLLQQVQKPGIQPIDEVFSAEPDVTNGLNGLLESSTRAISTPDGIVKMHPECRVIATANTNGRQVSNMYQGALVQDFSLLDRFVQVKVGYNPEVERKMLERLEDPDVEDYLHEKLQNLRAKIEENNIQFDPSTRKLLDVIKMVVGGIGHVRAFELAFLDPLSRAERLKVGM
jgi:MoxR-like ATPase